jgi:hypothetical protein
MNFSLEEVFLQLTGGVAPTEEPVQELSAEPAGEQQ